MLPSDELQLIYSKQKLVIEEEVHNLFQDFVKKAPVGAPETWKNSRVPKGYISGSFQKAWAYKQNLNGSWSITNDVEYASILFDGYNGIYGSKQWRSGGYPMMSLFKRVVEKKLDNVKV